MVILSYVSVKMTRKKHVLCDWLRMLATISMVIDRFPQGKPIKVIAIQ